jgi:predicted double-glycine peptidase
MKLKDFLKSNHVKGFPNFRQIFTYDCGSNATQMIMSYLGVDKREEVIMKELGTTEENGTPISAILKYFDENKVKYKVRSEMSFDDLKRNIDRNNPTLVIIQAWADEPNKVDWRKDTIDGHYVIAIGYDQKNVYFEDPSSSKRTYIPIEEFMNRWHDEDPVNGTKFVRFGVEILSPPDKNRLEKME